MNKKIIQAFVWACLTLEIHIRRTRIKHSAIRMRLVKWLFGWKNYPYNFKLFLSEHEKTAYLTMPKVASKSLQHTLFKSEDIRNDFLHAQRENNKRIRIPRLIFNERETGLFPLNIKGIDYHPKKKWRIWQYHLEKGSECDSISLDEVNRYFIFTFVRNPFSRLTAFFRNKYSYQDNYYHGSSAQFAWIKKVSSFDDLIKKISKLPDNYLEIHSRSQYFSIKYFTDLGGVIDFIGKYENLEKEFLSLKSRFDLLPLDHLNKSAGKKDWRDYYTPKTAKLVYERYRKDFEMFSYEEEYPKLLDYLASKSRQNG